MGSSSITWTVGLPFLCWHPGHRFGMWDEILSEPPYDDVDLYASATSSRHYARGLAYASKGLVAEAEAEQVGGGGVARSPRFRTRSRGLSRFRRFRHVVSTST